MTKRRINIPPCPTMQYEMCGEPTNSTVKCVVDGGHIGAQSEHVAHTPDTHTHHDHAVLVHAAPSLLFLTWGRVSVSISGDRKVINHRVTDKNNSSCREKSKKKKHHLQA